MSSRIAITAPFGYSIKNLLYSSFWDSSPVRQAEKIVIFTPTPQVYKDFLKEKGIRNVQVEKYASYVPGKVARAIWLLHKMRFLYKTGSETEKVKWQVYREEGAFGWLLKSAVRRVSLLIPESLLVRALYFFTPKAEADLSGFTSWLSLAPSFEVDIPFAKSAQAVLGIQKIAFIHSWDNLTSKGALIAKFDKVAVWGQAIYDEVRAFYRYEPGQIHIVGMPQYDGWDTSVSKKSPYESPYFLYATGHPVTVPTEPVIIEHISQVLAQRFPEHLLVIRLHPNDSADRFGEVVKGNSWIIIEEPGKRTKDTVDFWEPQLADMQHFHSLLAHAELVMNVASTITLDAARAHVPVVCIGFDAEPVASHRSVRRFYDYSHYRVLLLTKAVAVAYTPEEFLSEIQSMVQKRSWYVRRQEDFLELHDSFQDDKAGMRLGDLL